MCFWKLRKPKKNESKPVEETETQPEQAEETRLSASAWNEKGNASFREGAYEDAISAYQQAIQLEPTFGWPYSNLALTYLAQGRQAEAILLYQKGIALVISDKEKALCWNGLGNAHRSLNDYASAIAAYQKAAELDPETAGMRDTAETPITGPGFASAKVWNDLGEIFLKTGVYGEAATAFSKAIQLDPGFGWPYSNLGRTLASQGKHAQAIPYYQKSIELLQDRNDKAVSWNRLGNTYRKLNDYDNAIKAFQAAIALNDEGMDLVTRTRFSLLSNCYAD